MVNAIAPINQSLVVDVGKGNNIDHVVTDNGIEVLECLCGDGIRQIEHCPLKVNNCCLVLQKDTKHYCKAIIISKQIDYVMLVTNL